ncbi:MAG: alpha/beta hydrolase [Anaerolineae bacterium]|nr:alpha/beta hydrolase [Thermoflexales bacterium]MDW8408212.1 alpha/beta hydrolase [Anaerolineae bacterium]
MQHQNTRHDLERFRTTHPPRSIIVNGLRWDYRIVGAGESCMLILPGIHGKGELNFRLAEAMWASFRIILPNYPPARRMTQLADGIIAILDAEGIQQAHLFGSSYGGMVAQQVAQQYPERIGRLILATTTAPKNEPLRRTRMLARFATFLITEGLKKAARRSTPVPHHGCLAVSTRELVSAFSARTLVCRLLAAAEFLQHQSDYAMSASAGNVLILLGERDPIFTRSEWRNLSSFYPQAAIHVVREAGHFLEPEVQAAFALPFLAG